MPRFFVSEEQIKENEIIIAGNDVNHIKNVLRMAAGDEISISDGSGWDYFCTIDKFQSDAVVLKIENKWHSYVELGTKLYLFQGLPKSDKMELIIQKAVELGVHEIIPIKTKRTIVKLDDKKQQKKLARWQEIAKSAAKQSGRGIIPVIKAPLEFKEAICYSRELELNLIPYEQAEGIEAARDLIKRTRDKQSIGIFIGPEGGFDSDEIELAVGSGVHPMTLGRRILRTETAGLAILSILMFELEQ